MKSFKSKISNILFWSIVSAAFIGPGTVTTATKAGANFQFDLLWALVFSTFACLLLQEASARITIKSGLNLGQAIARQFEGRSSKTLILALIIGAIIIGSAAYEAGNILGSIAGLALVFDIPQQILVFAIGLLAFLALSLKSIELIAKIMGGIVFLMGIAFFTTAIQLKPSFTEILKGSFIPSIPDIPGAGLLVLGIIGTTVVPYDLFLGSGVLDKKQAIRDMRIGVSVAVILGGIISMAIMTVGTIITSDFTYEALAQALTYKIGPYAVYIFGFGMFAAGFSSAITAPLASAITARSLFDKKSSEKWKPKGLYFKLIYLGVLMVGLIFGMAEVKPIPAIIIAQALNGLILPFISVFLIYVINDPVLMGEGNTNNWFSNILMGIVMWVTMIIGIINIIKAIASIIGINIVNNDIILLIVAILTFLISVAVLVLISKYKRKREVYSYFKNLDKKK
ncbi:MAG: Nramp family divalent metal transporter [Bacteroidales bacterium]|nr:Nramp family divalent metal transporter [Bacteroidales bacterium]MBN2756297.1 Nramp family divalent metal transporter [Bacteroidales bacterium]